MDLHGRAPSLLLPGPTFPRRLPECYLFADFRENASARLPSSAAQPVDPACFLSSARRRFDPTQRRHGPAAAPDWSGPPGHAFNAPNAHATRHAYASFAGRLRPLFPGPSRPVLSSRLRPKIRADKPFTRGPKAWRSGHFGTLVGATGGDPNTLAPNRLKARPCPLRPSRTSTSF